MDNLEEETITGRYQKTIIGLLIGVLLIGGILLYLWQYSSVLGGMSQQVVKNPLQQNAVSLTQIKEDYEINYSRIINNYVKADPANADFINLTTSTKEQLLALKVPAIYKESHLSTFLIFSSIESALAKKDLQTVSSKLSELKKINSDFSSAPSN